ncbi:ribosome small subunit-dependent GTPase A [Alicyclobacillus fodiniaquatilis]|uniref:Small ribosomal subunit biogenesis GTPase RsgA n=1 Tax=Alicyclobacillus fodiniaquatilis TaxID=1661150 RepID=A0ABW4JHR5_9BACL
MDLVHWGWNSIREEEFSIFKEQGFCVGRIVSEHKHLYKVMTIHGELHAEVSGKIRHDGLVLERRDLFPAVGDWVLVKIIEHEKKAIIHGFLSRMSKLSRKVSGNKVYEQIVAANIDFVFLLSSLNNEFNERRLERGLVVSWDSGAQPVIVLTKADLCTDMAAKVAAAQRVARGVSVHIISSITHDGIESLSRYLRTGSTIALLGSSGVGKSTLVNCLMGEQAQRVNDIRQDDDKGRHTTTHRELMILPNGGLIIDTPGMREIQLWEASDGLNQTYQDIEEIALGCYYKDCLHRDEPRCAVKDAVFRGELDSDRFESYKKMQSEFADLSLKRSGHIRAVAKERGGQYAQLLQSQYSKKKKGRRTLK